MLVPGAFAKRLPTPFQGTNRPDFEIITKEEVWWQIAEGSLAPVRAFYENKMGLRGNILLGERL